MKLKDPLPYPSSFTQQPSASEIQSAKKMDAMRNQPENYIDTIDGVERRQGINIKARDKNTIEFKNQFPNGSTIDAFHLTVDSRQLPKLSYIHIYVDGERTVTVPVADLFHVSYDSSGKLMEKEQLLFLLPIFFMFRMILPAN